MNPATLTPDEAQEALKALNAPHTAKLTDYLAGRFLGPKEGDVSYWTGPMLPAGHDEYPEMLKALLKIGNGCDNLIQTSLETYLDTLEGLEDWRLVPEGAEEAPDARSEDEQALTAYLDCLNLTALTYHLGLTLAAHGRTVARPVLSARAYDDRGNIKPARDLADALSRIHWQAPGWPKQSRMVSLENAGVVLDEETLERFSVLAYQVKRNGRDVKGTEISWVDPDTAKTFVRIVEEGKENAVPVPHDLGGRLLLLEGDLPRPFVMPSLIGAFEAYHVASVMMNRNTHYAGFVERWAVGVQPPGEWIAADGSASPVWTTTHNEFRPIPISTGPGRTNFYQPGSSIETVTENGVTREMERPTPAQMGRWEPVDPKAIQAALEHWRKAIRSEARQSFLELSDNADASGRSREVAAGDYLRAAEKLKHAVTALLRDLLELTLHLAALQLPDGEAARLRGQRVVINSRVKAFPVSTEARRILLSEYEAGVIDHETLLTESGRENAAPIMAAVERERAERASAMPEGGGAV